MSVANTDPKGERAFVTVLLVVAAALRFFRLGYQSIWVDEIMTIQASTPTPGYSIWHLILYNIHGPLHAFVVFVFRSLHDTDAWLRVPSAIAGVAAVGVFYAWVSRWLGRRTARIAALLIAIHPLLIHYSQEVRNYSFVFLFSLVGCYLFDRFTERPTRRLGAAYVLSMAAAALSNFSAAFVFAAHTVIYFLRGGVGWRSVRRWVLVAAAVLVVISPWVYRIYTYIDVSDLVTPVLPGQIETGERLRGATTVTWEAIPYTLYAFGAGFTLGPSLRELHQDPSLAGAFARHWPAIVAVAVLFGWLLLAGLRRSLDRRRVFQELVVYLSFPIVFTLLLNWQNAKAFNVRYVLLSLPAYLCLVALGAQGLGRRWRAWSVLACAVTMSVSLAQYYFDGSYAREDVKRAMRYIDPRLDTNGGNECIFAPTVFKVAARYRSGDTPIRFVYPPRGPNVERAHAQLDSLFAACNSFWYVKAREWVADPDDWLERAISEYYDEVERQAFDGVKVIRYVRKNHGGAGT